MSYIEEERKRYNRAVGVAEYILEGNTKKEAMKEFRVSRDTIDRDLDFLKNCYYGNEKRNLQLYDPHHRSGGVSGAGLKRSSGGCRHRFRHGFL